MLAATLASLVRSAVSMNDSREGKVESKGLNMVEILPFDGSRQHLALYRDRESYITPGERTVFSDLLASSVAVTNFIT